MALLDDRVKEWEGLVRRWPDRAYEIAEGCDGFDWLALEQLEARGVVWLDVRNRRFGASEAVQQGRV